MSARVDRDFWAELCGRLGGGFTGQSDECLCKTAVLLQHGNTVYDYRSRDATKALDRRLNDTHFFGKAVRFVERAVGA